jgi:PAS domain S-box-containing protein
MQISAISRGCTADPARVGGEPHDLCLALDALCWRWMDRDQVDRDVGLDGIDPLRLVRALEAAAAQVGLALYVARVDGEPRFVYVSPLAARIYGRAASDVVGGPPWQVLAESDRARLEQLTRSRTAESEPVVFEANICQPDGTIVPCECGASRVAHGGAVYTIGYFRDVSSQHEVLRALRRSEARFRRLIEDAPDGIVILRGPTMVFANARAAGLLGLDDRESALGRSILSFVAGPEAVRAGDRLQRMLTTGEDFPMTEYTLAGASTVVEIKAMPFDWEGGPAVLAFARDVTQRRILLDELVRTQRLAAIGTLAAAVAHEINNPLTYAQLALGRLGRELASGQVGPGASGLVSDALAGIERVAGIVRDLRVFSRDDRGEVMVIDPIGPFERALRLVAHRLGATSVVERDFTAGLRVAVDPARLEQVFVNLLINAAQSSAQTGADRQAGVVVTVRVRAEADTVVCEVGDRGVGIPAPLLERVFEPFFTTKGPGEGTGLGLTVCRRIIDAAGGQIELDSQVGRGTVVRVRLPEVRARAELAPTPPSPARVRRQVLVVDDEPLVRQLVTMSLDGHHQVTAVASVPAALAAIAIARPEVILCDLVMPGQGGLELHQQVAELDPALARRIVFVTGGAYLPGQGASLDRLDNLVLLKPFDEASLLDMVDAAAARPDAGGGGDRSSGRVVRG